MDNVSSMGRWKSHAADRPRRWSGAHLSRLSEIVGIVLLLCPLSSAQEVSNGSQPSRRVVIAADTVLDGKGGELRKTRIVIEGSKIVAFDPKAKPIDYDLRSLTVLPGWIDSHVHITSTFGNDGKYAGGDGVTYQDALRRASNAWDTLTAGFTTVQNMGGPGSLALRDAIQGGSLPGPRILSASTALGAPAGTAEDVRAFIRGQKKIGADLVKIYASGGMRQGKLTITQEQLDAACDEAKKARAAYTGTRLRGSCTRGHHGGLCADRARCGSHRC